MIYEYFRVTGAHDTVLNYTALFSITLRNDNVQEFDTGWTEILSLSKITTDEVLESLYKLLIRESDPLKKCWELYTWEIHQQRSKPDHPEVENHVDKSTDQKSTPSPETFSRRKSPRSRSPFGKLARKTCRDYVNGQCTKPSFNVWHTPEC